MKLYFSPGACSLSPHIALQEAGAQFQTEKVDLKTKKTATGADFLKINPKGQVPTFQVEEGKILTEGAVIVQYIADKFPEKNLLPKYGTWERVKANEWLNYIASDIHKTMGSLFAVDSMIPNKEGNEQFRMATKETMYRKFDYLATHLSTNQFLLGTQFSVVDAYLFTCMNWHKPLAMDLTKWPKLMGYMERVQTRPAVQTAMRAEGLL